MKIHTIKTGTTNCYLIEQESSILIDAGMPGKIKSFNKYLNKSGIRPWDIKLIIITHCHWDHIGLAAQIKEMTGAQIVVHRSEQRFLETREILMPPAVTTWGKIFSRFLKFYAAKLQLTPAKADIILGNDEFSLYSFGFPAQILHTPGHSRGSISVLFEMGECFVGDMAMNGLPLTLRPSLPIFAEDTKMLKNSWQKLKELGAETIFPAHGKRFLIDEIQEVVSR